MSFVYLILVHKNPQQLAKLVQALMTDNAHFIIHVDKKCRIDDFRNILSFSDNIIFSKQVKVSWGGFGMIEATLEMLHTMYANNIHPDYVHLLSGQDFPLKSNHEIFCFFRENCGKNFLEAHAIPSPRLSELGLNRIQYKWFIEDEGYHKAAMLVDMQKQRNMIRPFFDDVKPYNGSQWWSLTGECVRWLYETCRPGNRLYDFYKYTFCSDEMLFHTVLLNSRWKDSVMNNNFRYIDWDSGPEYPKIWRSEDFERLVASNKLFARKFDETVDKDILNKIKKYRDIKSKSLEKSIIIFRFHRYPHICLNRIELLKLYNSNIPIYGIYGGNEKDFREFDELLSVHLAGIYIIKGKTNKWKWRNFDLALREWYNDYGKDIDFDMAYVVEWDLIIFGSLKEIYSEINENELGITGLMPLSSVENQWFWTTGVLRDEYIKLMVYVQKTHKYSQTPFASLGPGLCFPKSFLAAYSAIDVPELSNDEMRVPLFAQILGYSMKNTGFFEDWFNPEERKHFNCTKHPISINIINRQLQADGHKVFHPFWNLYPLERLKYKMKSKTVPKIIHQIWSDKYKPLPDFCASLAETWKEKHPDWKYICWNEEMTNNFVDIVYPGLSKFYHSLPYDIQRWDAVRFLILYKMGGIYVDFDYKCMRNIEPLLPEGKDFYIAVEPQNHASSFDVCNLLSNALMACVPKNVFVRKIINKIFSVDTLQCEKIDKFTLVLNTTGPLMVSRVYENLSPKEKKYVHLFPAENIIPFNSSQIRQADSETIDSGLRDCLKEVYAIRYFTRYQ